VPEVARAATDEALEHLGSPTVVGDFAEMFEVAVADLGSQFLCDLADGRAKRGFAESTLPPSKHQVPGKVLSSIARWTSRIDCRR